MLQRRELDLMSTSFLAVHVSACLSSISLSAADRPTRLRLHHRIFSKKLEKRHLQVVRDTERQTAEFLSFFLSFSIHLCASSVKQRQEALCSLFEELPHHHLHLSIHTLPTSYLYIYIYIYVWVYLYGRAYV